MKKYITIITAGLALAFTGLYAQETPDYAQIVGDTKAIEDDATRRAEATFLGDQYGPDLLTKLQAGEQLTIAESWILYWYFTNPVEDGIDETVAAEVFTRSNQLAGSARFGTVKKAASSVSDAQVANLIDSTPGAFGFNVRLAWQWHSWDDEALRDTYRAKVIANNVGKGYSLGWWISLFKQYRSKLTKAEQIALTQKEKDGLIAVPSRSAAQDKWLNDVSVDLMALSLDQ